MGGGVVDGGAITLCGVATLSPAGGAELLPTFGEEATGGAEIGGLPAAVTGAVTGDAFETRSSD